MTHRQPAPVPVAFVLVVALVLPETGRAQNGPPVVVEESSGRADRGHHRPGGHILHRGKQYEPIRDTGNWHNSGYPYGPRVAPAWGYYGLGGGPFIGYPGGWWGYPAAAFDEWTNGLSLYGPPVPVYGPIPGVFGNNDLVRRWQGWPSIGMPFGWVGLYAASPRPRPLTVGSYPTVESVPFAPGAAVAAPIPAAAASTAGSLVLSVKVPQPAAEVFVDGVKTLQTGTDRVFESPPLVAGKQFKYEVTAKWIEGGVPREVKKAVVGTPGEVVRVDFTNGN